MTQKFLKLFSILALFFALFFISCSNENTTGSAGGNGELETPQTDTPTSKAFVASLPIGTEIPASSGSSSSGGSSSGSENIGSATITYTFEANGNLNFINTVTDSTGNATKETTTYTFWGAKENGRGIYYIEGNLQDNPNYISIRNYYGITYDSATKQLTMYGPTQDYGTKYEDWMNNNIDPNTGEPKADADWNSYPQQTTDEIDWTTPY